MAKYIYVQRNRINSPWCKLLLATYIILLTAGVAAVALSLALALFGVLVTAVFVLVGIVVIAVLLAVPLLLLGGSALGVLLAPFALLRLALTQRRR